MREEILPADPRVLIGHTQTLMAELYLDEGLPDYCFTHLEKTKNPVKLPTWLQLRRGVLYRRAGKPKIALRVFHALGDSDLDEAEVHYQQTLCWIAMGKWNSALQSIRLAQANRSDERFVELMGDVMDELGKLKEALELYDSALKGLDRHYARIYLYEKRGELAKAIEEVGQALGDFPRDAFLFAKRAQLKTDSGDLTGAHRDYSDAISLDEEADFLASRALVSLELGKLDHAARDAESAVALEPHGAEPLKALAEVLDAQEELGASAVFWARYTKASKDLRGLLFQAEVLNRVGEIERSDRLLERYVKLRPKCWEATYYKMAFLRTREEYEAAELLAQDVVRVEPDEYTLLYERTKNFLEWGRYETATEHCLELRRRFPDSLEIREFWVHTLTESSRYQLALEEVEKILFEENNVTNYLLSMKADILGKLHRWREALEILDDLIKSEPDNAGYYVERAEALYSLCRMEDSLRDIDRSLELDPENQDLRVIKAWVNVRRGAFDLASAEAADLLKEDLKYSERLICRGIWLGGRIVQRVKRAFLR